MRPLLLALAPVALAQDAADPSCDMAAAIIQPEQPVVLAAFRESMASYPALDPADEPEEMVTARNSRKTTRETYDPRRMVAPSWIPGELSMYELAEIAGIATEDCELEGSCPDTISARFCGLDYPECPAPVEGEWPPAALVCAGVEPGNRTCGSAEITTYTIGVLLPGATPVVLGIVLMVIWMLWWMLRFVGCCGCGFGLCGGCKPGKAKKWWQNLICGCVSYDAEHEPAYVTQETSWCSQLGLCRIWFFLVCGVCILSGVISFYGNNYVKDGINDALDVGMYDLKDMVYNADQILNELQTITAGTEADGMLPADLAENLRTLNCDITGSKQGEVDKIQDEYLEYRELGTLVVIAIPVVLSVFYIIGMLCEMCCKKCPGWAKCCLRLNSVLVWLLVIVVCISAAAHLVLTLVFADICYEFDLHLAKYQMTESPYNNTPENLNFLPEEAKGFCGEGGTLAFMEDEFDTQMDTAIQAGCDAIVEQCNDPEMQGFMDCSGVSFLTGTAPAYSATVPAGGASEYNGYLADVPDELMITDVDLTVVADTDTSSIPNKVKNCLAGIETGDPTAPYDDSGWDVQASTLEACTEDGNPVTVAYSAEFTAADGPADVIVTRTAECITQACADYMTRTSTTQTQAQCEQLACDGTLVYTSAYTPEEWTAIDGWAGELKPNCPARAAVEPTEDEVKQCFIDTEFFPQVTFRECATSCSMDDARTQAAELVTALDSATSTFDDVYTLFDDDVRPLLQCTFVSEVISDLFYPLCVDAFGGFTWIVAGHIVSLVMLLLSFPIGIASTKRLVGVGEEGDSKTGERHYL